LSYGPLGLQLLAEGHSAEEVTQSLVGRDPGSEHRQLGVVDAEGRGASFTGNSYLDWAGGLAGDGFAAQGNLLVSSDTVDALAEAFELSSDLAMASRLVTCLEMAQRAGGDRRGEQSAALLVVREGGGYGGWNDRVVDLRVDDHPSPIQELGRLLELHQRFFGRTEPEKWLPVDQKLKNEIGTMLEILGYAENTIEQSFLRWSATENLEERTNGFAAIDPVVLEALRSAARSKRES
jgi:uncharacterized Ntn-hydrolase superfamily protein